jgi:hypothetical protein
MYFFHSNLSLADIGFSSSIIPTILVNVHTHTQNLSPMQTASLRCPVSLFLVAWTV